MRHLRAWGAGAALVVLVIGAPVALAAWGTGPGVLLDWSRPDDGSVLLALLTAIGWLAWAAFAASVGVEIVNLLGRRTLRLPVLAGLQSVAAGLVLAAFSSLANAAPAPALTMPAPVTPTTPATTTATAVPAAVVPTVEYVVGEGDDLWGIADAVLGDGSRWRALAEANPDLLASPTDQLAVGTRLRLPADATPPHQHRRAAPAPQQFAPGQETRRATTGTVTVVKGDTLSELAEEHLGDAGRWPTIHRANDDLIDDPDLIQVGWKLVIPGRPAAPPEPARQRPVRKPAVMPEAPDLRVDTPGRPPAVETTPATTPSAATTPAATPTAAPTGAAASAPAPAQAPTPEVRRTESAETASDDLTVPLVGGIGGLAAAVLIGGLQLRRLGQLRARPVGRRILHPPVDLRRYETALGQRGRPESPLVLEKALRHLGAHCHTTGRALPHPRLVVIDDVAVSFHWPTPPGPAPAVFQVVKDAWVLSAAGAAALPAVDHPVPFPALVTLGRTEDGWLMVDLEARPLLALDGPPALRHAAVAAMAVELGCAPWASELSLTVVGGDEMFIRAACPELVGFTADPAVAVELLEQVVEQRSNLDVPLETLRVDPDRAEAAAAHIVLFADRPREAAFDRLAGLTGTGLGVGCLVAGSGEQVLLLSGDPDRPTGLLLPDGVELKAQVIAAHTRAAIGTIFAATDEANHEPAPWWKEGDAEDNVRPLVARRTDSGVRHPEPEPTEAEHPELRILGPIELVGAAGTAPSRARRQCEEYCAWLLEHPGATATRMANELIVAETTRRSNMSRLRSWLGAAPDGSPYLPDAYSGRIELHPAVASDWQRVQVLIGPGINRVSTETLLTVLELVRGAPLADAAPGQWHWAEELRTDIASVVRDVGVVLARRALIDDDVELARWAAARALLACPEDEQLLVERIRTEHRAGNHPEVERLVRWVTQQARKLGADLAPETVEACQQAMEGRARARA